MICYKCDMCGDIHYAIGEMDKIKISYAGEAHCTYRNNGEYLVCEPCRRKLEELLSASIKLSGLPYVECSCCSDREYSRRHNPKGENEEMLKEALNDLKE